MKLTKEEVRKIAKLCRLEFTEEELEKFQKDLSRILDFVEQLNEVDTQGVEPTYQVTGLFNVFRQDEVKESSLEERRKIRENFPDQKDNFLKVPKIK